MSLIDLINNLDRTLLILINNDSDSKWLDPVMLTLRNPLTWIPLYILMVYFAFKMAKQHAWQFIIVSIATFAFTDSISARLMKPIFARVRPCFDDTLHGVIRNLVDCGGMYSFPSSHAANHFGLAAFWYFSILKMTGRKWHWLWFWAASISYAQVYVAKHYPLDVIAGAFFGYATGYTAYLIFKKWAFPSSTSAKNKKILAAADRRNPSLLQ